MSKGRADVGRTGVVTNIMHNRLRRSCEQLLFFAALAANLAVDRANSQEARPTAQKVMSQQDTNGDGNLTREEWRSSRPFERFDIDRDGVIKLSEHGRNSLRFANTYPPMCVNPPPLRMPFIRVDGVRCSKPVPLRPIPRSGVARSSG